MPLVWTDEQFTEGGVKGIRSFIGTLSDVEDGVEGNFGEQVRFDFSDVEVLESDEPFVPQNGGITIYVKDSPKKGSTKHKVMTAMVAFAKQHNMGPVPSCFIDVPLKWEYATFDYGPDINPGRGPIPVGLADGEAPVSSDDSADSDYVPSDDVIALVKEKVDSDGVTSQMLRRALASKAAGKNALKDAGLDAIVAGLVTAEVLYEDDGVYFLAE